jgi:hypothetical protein
MQKRLFSLLENTDENPLSITHCVTLAVDKLSQLLNTELPIPVTPSSIVTLVKPLHPENAQFPMLVTG